MISFPTVDEFSRYLSNALRLSDVEIARLRAEIQFRKEAVPGPWADYVDYDPVHHDSYVGRAAGEFVVIHGQQLGEPAARVVVQHLY
jgi:hypothetical protein